MKVVSTRRETIAESLIVGVDAGPGGPKGGSGILECRRRRCRSWLANECHGGQLQNKKKSVGNNEREARACAANRVDIFLEE